MKLALGVEYDGTAFSGWQRQTAARTVQACVEQALAVIANHDVQTICAGRTDAGVHARAQVVHFTTVATRPPRAWILGTNAHLPPDVSVVWMRDVDDSFHARFSASARSYCYVICNRVARPGLWARRMAFVPGPLDESRMAAGARWLLGEHDFSSFRAAGCQSRHARRLVRAITVARRGELVFVRVTANAFVQHMVRNIVGTLLVVGQGREPPDWVRHVLAARDRAVAGVTAAPDGLYLTGVEYPDHYGIPAPGAESDPWFGP